MVLTCIICLEKIKENDAAATPCGHIFDRVCIQNWTRQSGSCGYCRKVCYSHQITYLFNKYDEDTSNTRAIQQAKDQITREMTRVLRESTDHLRRVHKKEVSLLKAKTSSYITVEQDMRKKIQLLAKNETILKQKNNELDERLERQSKKFASHIVENAPIKDNERKLKEQLKEKEDTIKQILVDKASVVLDKQALKEANEKLISKYKILVESKNKVDEEMKIMSGNMAIYESAFSDKYSIDKMVDLLHQNGQQMEKKNTLMAEANKEMEKKIASEKKQNASCKNCEKLTKQSKEILGKKSKLEFDLTKANNRCAKLSTSLEDLKKESENTKKEHEKTVKVMTDNNAKLFEKKENCIKELKSLRNKMAAATGEKTKDVKKSESSSTSSFSSAELAALEKRFQETKTMRNRLIRESNKFKQKTIELQKKNDDLLKQLKASSTINHQPNVNKSEALKV